MKRSIPLYTLCALTLLIPRSWGAVAYPDPPGGWSYIYSGDQRVVGDNDNFSWLDGTWSHNNGSDSFDGSEIGGTFVSPGNGPGGASLLTQGSDTFLRLQDTGDPRDYGYPDPSCRKIYFGHDVSGNVNNPTTVIDDGVTLTFRARIPTAAKASINDSFLIDPLHRDGQQAGGTVPYPAEGDGYVTWNDGKGNFVIRQGGDGTAEHPAGALAFSLTLPADNVGTGPAANFSGLTMNEKNGNVPSSNVDFGEGTATNLVAFDPTDWHEIYMVIRKDPANIATHEVFIFVDGNLTPQVFKITAGTGSDPSSGANNFIAMGGPATDQNWALDVDWFGFKNEAVFPPGSIDNLPPSITGVSIPENAMFQTAASGLSFQASVDAGSTNTLPVSGFNLTLNGQDLSSGLVVTGPDQSRSVTYSGLQANQFYAGDIIVSDQAGRKATNALSFDTFVESAGVVIESEDYNHSSGQFVADPQPGSYANLAGTLGTDYSDTTSAPADNNTYRQDAADLADGTDFPRDKFAGVPAGSQDRVIVNVQAGEWLNYTRSFAAGRHFVYLRAASPVNQSLRLDRVVGSASSSSQTLSGLGSFVGGRTGNLGLYKYAQLKDIFGNPISVPLSGQQTLRLTALTASDNLQHNLLFVVPDSSGVASPGAIAAASPMPNQINVSASPAIEITLADGANPISLPSVRMWFDGAEVTSSATVSDTADGARIAYSPGLLRGLSPHTIKVSFADTAPTPNTVEGEWTFTTAAYAALPPQLGTAIGTGADPGMKWRTHQAASTSVTSIATAEQALSGALGASIHEPLSFGDGVSWSNPEAGGFFIMNFVNLTVDTLADGQFTGSSLPPQNVADDWIPGLPGTTLSTDNTAAECLAYLEFPQAGLYNMVVNSDDGFKVSVGNASNPQWLTLGSYDGTRSADDTLFQVAVEQPGVYLFRLMWFQGTGGASVEWFTVNSDGSRALVNGSQTGAIRAYQRRTVAEPALPPDPPTITTQPQPSVAAYVGDTVALSVVASSSEAMTYQWTKDGFDIDGETSAALTLANVQLDDAGTYAVRVSNSGGSVTSNNSVVTVESGEAPKLNIAWVGFHTGDDTPSTAAVNAGFTQAPDVGYTQLLRDKGHTVTRIRTSGTPNVAQLNTFDLVIISRSVPSGDYQDAPETAAWNGVTSPTIVMGGYILRNNRLGFTTGGTIPDTTNSVALKVNDPAHPVFAGIALDGNNTMVNLFAGIATFTNAPQRGISVNTDPAVAGATVLATVATADPTTGGMIIGEYPAGVAMGNNRDTLAGHRLVFLSGSREASGLTSEGAGILDLTADGTAMFLNAVNYMADPKIRFQAPAIEGNNITITWSNGGTLEYGDTVTGTWISTENSSGSYTEPINETGDRFYRVIQPTP